MSMSAHPSHGHGHASRDLRWSWIAVAAMVLMLVAMPLLGSDFEPSFAVSAIGLAGALVAFLALAAVAIRFGLEARREGSEAGILPAAIGGAIGGLFLLLVLAVVLGHLLGFE